MNPTNPSLPSTGFLKGTPLPRRLGAWTITAALAAALAVWLVGETRLVQVAPKKVPMVTTGIHHEGTTGETMRAAVRATAARLYGLLGAVVGCALGAVGGLAGGRPRAAVRAAILGALLGTFAGAGVAYVAVPIFERNRDRFELDLITSMLMHGAIWASIGVTAGLAFGIGLEVRPARLVSCLIGGSLGALFGATVYDLVGAIIFANDRTGEPVALSSPSRLFGLVIIAFFIALGGLAAIREDRRATLRAPLADDSLASG